MDFASSPGTPKQKRTSVVDDNDPPYSRIFIVCGKSITEELLREKFSQCGQIEYPNRKRHKY